MDVERPRHPLRLRVLAAVNHGLVPRLPGGVHDGVQLHLHPRGDGLDPHALGHGGRGRDRELEAAGGAVQVVLHDEALALDEGGDRGVRELDLAPDTFLDVN